MAMISTLVIGYSLAATPRQTIAGFSDYGIKFQPSATHTYYSTHTIALNPIMIILGFIDSPLRTRDASPAANNTNAAAAPMLLQEGTNSRIPQTRSITPTSCR